MTQVVYALVIYSFEIIYQVWFTVQYDAMYLQSVHLMKNSFSY
jgi:hypothetical protein